MDIESFRSAANRVRAEQILQEKVASTRSSVTAVDAIAAARADLAEDPELLKVAARFCSSDPLGFYVKLGGKFGAPARSSLPDAAPVVKAASLERRATVKLAEPPPPPGMSVKAWDKVLSKGPPPRAKTAQLQLPAGLQPTASATPPAGISAATWNAVLNRGQTST